jgi:hypothetical protein
MLKTINQMEVTEWPCFFFYKRNNIKLVAVLGMKTRKPNIIEAGSIQELQAEPCSRSITIKHLYGIQRVGL